jgi:hypothetical protein
LVSKITKRPIGYPQLLAALLCFGQQSAWASHRLIDYQGKVFLQRKQSQGWASPTQVRRRGVPVISEDRIEVKLDSFAMVRCGGGAKELKSVDPGATWPLGRFCRSEEILRLASRVAEQLGGGDERIPYLIEPRATTVMGTPLPLRWNPVAGVKGYQLWLLRERDRQLLWGSRVENSNSALLPKNVNLMPGESYLMVVEADNGSSSQLDAGAAGQAFRRASQAEELNLARLTASLAHQKLHPEAAGLLQADLLSQAGLYAAAINSLEQHLLRHGKTVGLLLELGQLYARVGLSQLAYQRYLQASKLAGSGDDPDALAEARAGSSRALERLRDPLP